MLYDHGGTDMTTHNTRQSKEMPHVHQVTKHASMDFIILLKSHSSDSLHFVRVV